VQPARPDGVTFPTRPDVSPPNLFPNQNPGVAPPADALLFSGAPPLGAPRRTTRHLSVSWGINIQHLECVWHCPPVANPPCHRSRMDSYPLTRPAATLSPGERGGILKHLQASSNRPRAAAAGAAWMNVEEPDELFERSEFSSGRHSSVRRREPAEGGQGGRGSTAFFW